jgi:hypothetical protein
MSLPNELPLWIFKDDNEDDAYPYYFIYKITNKLYMIEYADLEFDIRGGPKTFISYSELKEQFFGSELSHIEMLFYNPSQCENNHYNFIARVIDNQQQPVIQPTPEMVVDEDPSSEDSEEPSE